MHSFRGEWDRTCGIEPSIEGSIIQGSITQQDEPAELCAGTEGEANPAASQPRSSGHIRTQRNHAVPVAETPYSRSYRRVSVTRLHSSSSGLQAAGTNLVSCVQELKETEGKTLDSC